MNEAKIAGNIAKKSAKKAKYRVTGSNGTIKNVVKKSL